MFIYCKKLASYITDIIFREITTCNIHQIIVSMIFNSIHYYNPQRVAPKYFFQPILKYMGIINLGMLIKI